MKQKSNEIINRRDFSKTLAVGTIGASISLNITASSYAKMSRANDKIGIGIIGLGNISHQHLKRLKRVEDKAQIVAVCDIYKPHLEWGVSEMGAKGYHDYHDLLADENVDAVIIATPDHWHAQMAIDAMRAGKDVDVEKPMCMSIEEAKEMVKVSEETGQILTIDSEHTAHGIWKPAEFAIKSGVIGKVIWSQTSRSRNGGEIPPWNYKIDSDANPQNLDWDRFLGPAPKRPFDKERYFRWRRYWDYSGGIATDLYVHHISPLIKITGPEFPVRGTATGSNILYPTDILQVPDTFLMTLSFQSEHAMIVGGSFANSVEMPIVVRGHEATIYFFGPDHKRPSYFLIEPELPFVDGFKEKVQNANLDGRWLEWKEIKELGLRYRKVKPVFRIDSPTCENFTENFLRCIHTREKPVLDGRLGYMAQVAVSLAVQSYRKNRIMFFDPDSEKVY
jgi:predicted dehydrogenase